MAKQKKEKIKIRFREAFLPPEELQRRMDSAFDILFDAVLNKKNDN